MDKAKIDRINYLARQSRERDRVYVVDDKGKQQKLIKDNENK